jgi:glutathionyl-hydroquinone reductase
MVNGLISGMTPKITVVNSVVKTVVSETGVKAEKDRYHLYVSLACPWAHRTLIFRQLKNLQDYISVTIVDAVMLKNGWEFSDS